MDTFVAIVTRLIIFPACFSFGVQPDQGPALIFVTLPNVLVNMTADQDLGYAFLSVYDIRKLFNGYCRV